jgi:tRNA uridine 5-carboxymethylaminomethyl modification enzyme
MAGINAHRKNQKEAPFTLSRSEAYIGVLIDDLITKGTDEPYRMFTSRAEYRILLRQDNADIRLTPIGHAIGMASDKALRRVKEKMSGAEKLKKSLRKEGVSPERANTVLARKKSAPVKQQVKLSSLITRPGIGMEDVLEMSVDSSVLATELNNVDPSIVTQTEIQLKYEGYISREEDVAKKMNRLEDVKIPEMIDYSKLTSLSAEAKEKLTALAPVTIGQASRISGISPSDVSVLLVYLGR